MRRRLIQSIVLIGAAAAGIGLMSIPWEGGRNPALARAVSELDGQWVGRPAPSFRLPDLQGQRHQLRDYRGKVIFLNFWASFCRPCKREMPSMEKLIRQYRGRGLVMLAVSMDPKKRDAQRFLQRFLPDQRSAMTVLWDPDGAISERYGTELIPETYIIDRDGRVVARFVNEYDWTRPAVKRLVETLVSS